MKNLKKFHTDEDYYTKAEFSTLSEKKTKGTTWKEVSEYREKFTFEIPLINSKKNFVKLTQTPWILQKEIRMISLFSKSQASMLTDLSYRYSSSTLMSEISAKSLVSETHWLLNSDGTNKSTISRTVIENLANKTDEPTNKDERDIVELFEKLELITSKITLPREIAKIFFGIDEINEQKFDDINASIVEVMRSDKINSVLTKMASLIYAILENDLFGEKSYEIMVLSLLSLARNSYKGEVLKGISLFKTLDYFRADLFKSVEDAKVHGGDLTYITLNIIDILLYSLRLSTEQIETFIKDEERYNSLTTKDKNLNYKAVLSAHPELSLRQAKFYVNHSDTKINYTLKDFQEYFGSSYETSRYSLEKLVELGFYKKKKIGKKFVYNAIRQK